MSTVFALIHDGALAVGIGAVLYTAPVTTAAFTALLAPTAQRRRDACTVLKILVRNRRGDDDRARNPHRSGVAWSKSAVRVILTNPATPAIRCGTGSVPTSSCSTSRTSRWAAPP